MCRLLATLHDDQGNVAIDGLVQGPAADLDYPVDRLRAESGVLPGVELIGTGSLVERIWTKPAVAVLAIDATRVADASNTLIHVARAKVSVRLAPGDDAAAGARPPAHASGGPRPVGCTSSPIEDGRPRRALRDRRDRPGVRRGAPAFQDAWDGAAPVDIGVGGSIPFIAEFAEAFPDAAILVTGVEDPDTRAHGANEGLHLAEFERVCLAEALLLDNTSPTSPDPRPARTAAAWRQAGRSE